MNYTVHGILQARILEWVAFPFSRGWSSLPKDQTQAEDQTLQADSLPAEPPGKPKNTGVGNLSLLRGIFPTQESKWGLLHGRQILCQLSSQGSPGGTVVKSLPANTGDAGLTPGLGRTPGEGNGNNALQNSCLRNPMDRGAWRITIHGVSKESDMTQRLNNSPPSITPEFLGPSSKGWHPQELRSCHSEGWNFLTSFKSSATNCVCVCVWIYWFGLVVSACQGESRAPL